MRVLAITLSLLLLSSTAGADVRLSVKKDGKKVIFNVGGRGAGKGADYNWLAKRHDRRSSYDPIIERYADKYGVDPVLVRAVIQIESDFNPGRVSHKGARGLMQLMPGTAKRFGVTQIHDPEQNIHGGVRYLAILSRMFRNDLPRVLAAYNAGENAVIRYGGIPPYAETSEYVRRGMTVYHGRPYGTSAVAFAGRRGSGQLRGGFGSQVPGMVRPTAIAILPNAKLLGSR